jgi:hypothetical protein
MDTEGEPAPAMQELPNSFGEAAKACGNVYRKRSAMRETPLKIE